jgi:hypothetical protein
MLGIKLSSIKPLQKFDSILMMGRTCNYRLKNVWLLKEKGVFPCSPIIKNFL